MMKLLPNISTLPLQLIENQITINAGVKLYMLRTDLTDSLVSGNKWFKLKYNLQFALENNYKTIVSFGGAYSNHLHALAAACQMFDLKLIAVVRGEEPKELSHTLKYVKSVGGELYWVDRDAYRQKTEEQFINDLKCKFGEFYLVPEGGSNILALKGTSEIIDFIKIDFDYLCCAVGTGGTIAGIVDKMRNENKRIIGFPALKNGEFLYDDIQKLLLEFNQTQIPSKLILQTDYHFGGYAKVKPELMNFIKSFENEFNIPLEQVYTGKMMYGIFNLLHKGYFENGKTIIAIHTGGLQGKIYL